MGLDGLEILSKNHYCNRQVKMVEKYCENVEVKSVLFRLAQY